MHCEKDTPQSTVAVFMASFFIQSCLCKLKLPVHIKGPRVSSKGVVKPLDREKPISYRYSLQKQVLKIKSLEDETKKAGHN